MQKKQNKKTTKKLYDETTDKLETFKIEPFISFRGLSKSIFYFGKLIVIVHVSHLLAFEYDQSICILFS
jgi:hypothetical protein